MSATMPATILTRLLQVGVTALAADTDLLDSIWDDMAADEREQMKTAFGRNPPAVSKGYARSDNRFPRIAVTLASDGGQVDFLAQGEMATLDGTDTKTGDEWHRWNRATYNILVYAHQAEQAEALYRVVRRIVNVGRDYLIARGLDEPAMDGAELAPNPRYTPDNLFVRRVSVSVEYQEEWYQDGLWEAINGEAEAFITSADQLNVAHEDSEGEIKPRTFAAAEADPEFWNI